MSFDLVFTSRILNGLPFVPMEGKQIAIRPDDACQCQDGVYVGSQGYVPRLVQADPWGGGA